MRGFPLALLPLVLAAACDGAAPPPTPDAAPDATPDAALDAAPDAPSAEPVSVTLFERTHLYFAGMDNRRTVDATARFPDAVVGRYGRATLTLTLACPSGRCDAWDRVAALSLLDEARDGGPATELEFARFVTPYGVGGSWTLDVTPILPLFRGERRVRAFIDTWVGPGHAQGNGWLLTASLALEPGAGEASTREVIPLGWSRMVYGDPARPAAMQLPPRTVTFPAWTRRARVWVSATGHGQGNRDNCAEFCARLHAVTLDGARVEHELWRDDCAENPVSNQRGNWRPPRAGWCPGDVAPAWVAELPAASPGPHTVGYDVEAQENTCRPGAPMPCTNCVFRTGCDYNDSTHTEPYYRIAAYLLLGE